MSSSATAGVGSYQNFVNGKWESATSGKTFPVYDPSTEEVIAQVAAADAADVDRAVKAARAAFDTGPWPQTTAQDRGRILFKLADKVRQNAAMLSEMEARNTGKPIVEAEYDITDVATCFEYYGGLASKVTGQVLPVPANALSFTLKEPMGVAGQIIPWNYPLVMAAWKLAPALAAGMKLRSHATIASHRTIHRRRSACQKRHWDCSRLGEAQPVCRDSLVPKKPQK